VSDVFFVLMRSSICFQAEEAEFAFTEFSESSGSVTTNMGLSPPSNISQTYEHLLLTSTEEVYTPTFEP